MDEYDLIVVGGGIAGSVAAKYTSKGGLTKRNQSREINVHNSNGELQSYLTGTMIKTGLSLMIQSAFNRFRPLNKIIMLPP